MNNLIRTALEKCAGALSRSVSEKEVVRFTGKWSHLGSMTVSDILDEADKALDPESDSAREEIARAWLYGHCAARGFSFTEIDYEGCKGSKLWHEALDIADRLREAP